MELASFPDFVQTCMGARPVWSELLLEAKVLLFVIVKNVSGC